MHWAAMCHWLYYSQMKKKAQFKFFKRNHAWVSILHVLCIYYISKDYWFFIICVPIYKYICAEICYNYAFLEATIKNKLSTNSQLCTDCTRVYWLFSYIFRACTLKRYPHCLCNVVNHNLHNNSSLKHYLFIYCDYTHNII